MSKLFIVVYSIVFWILSSIFWLLTGRYIFVDMYHIDDFYAVILLIVTLVLFPIGIYIFDRTNPTKTKVINSIISILVLMLIFLIEFFYIMLPAAMKSIPYGI